MGGNKYMMSDFGLNVIFNDLLYITYLVLQRISYKHNLLEPGTAGIKTVFYSTRILKFVVDIQFWQLMILKITLYVY